MGTNRDTRVELDAACVKFRVARGIFQIAPRTTRRLLRRDAGTRYAFDARMTLTLSARPALTFSARSELIVFER